MITSLLQYNLTKNPLSNEKVKCKICKHDSYFIFKGKLLKKYKIKYYQCSNCLFVQTEKEYWLKEAYKNSINITDTGILSRNLILGVKTSLILNFFFDRKKNFLDYAGGYGIFTRLMRDIGFDFYWYDPYTENKLARGFEGSIKKKYEVITLFESFEHFQTPLKELNSLLKITDTLIFSTTLLPKPTPNAKNWWYYGLEHGQHIAFYSKETFEYISKEYNVNYFTDGKYLHIYSKKKLSKFVFRVMTSPIGFLLFPLVLINNKSKTITDSKMKM